MPAPHADSPVTVMSYNILNGGKDRLDRIVEVIRGVRPDALALIEAGDAHGVRWLADQVGMAYRIFPSRVPYSMAVLSPHPMRDVDAPNPFPGRRSRLAPVWIRFPGCGDRLLVAVHLSSRLAFPWGGRDARVREVQSLLAQLAEYRQVPHLLVGDFNAAPRGEGMARHRQRDTGHWFATDPRTGLQSRWRTTRVANQKHLIFGWCFEALQHAIAHPVLWPLVRPLVVRLNPWQVLQQVTAAGYVDCFDIASKQTPLPAALARHTWPSWSPVAKIDHVFATPDVAPDVVDCWVVDASPAHEASDHLPVAVRLRWCPPA